MVFNSDIEPGEGATFSINIFCISMTNSKYPKEKVKQGSIYTKELIAIILTVCLSI
jgi:hypothetical protein